jgi:hypothetical protein
LSSPYDEEVIDEIDSTIFEVNDVEDDQFMQEEVIEIDDDDSEIIGKFEENLKLCRAHTNTH